MPGMLLLFFLFFEFLTLKVSLSVLGRTLEVEGPFMYNRGAPGIWPDQRS